MGLIKTALGSLGGNLADQWKEMIYCESIPADVLAVKGQKRTNERTYRTSNVKGDDNIITNGSIVVVNDGQCALIVEQGKIVDVVAEPGEFKYDNTLAPSILSGSLGKGIVDTFKNIGKRFTYGGDTGTDQRVYYFNTKEIIGNRYGTITPIPFRVVDANIGLDIDSSVRCNGEFSYKIVDPLLFYTHVCGNVEDDYSRDEIADQMRSELLTELQPAFARISAMGVRYSAIPAHTTEVVAALQESLSHKWGDLRGIQIVSFGVNAISLSPEDEQTIKQLQRTAVFRDPTMAAANLAGAQADAMVGAANNQGGFGAMGGFIGMGMAQNAGGMDAASLYNMGQQRQQPMPQQQMAAGGGFGAAAPQQQAPQQPSADEWTCPSCGTKNTAKFCMECGTPRPVEAPQPKYRCDKCGWVPEDQSKPPKFCPECGDPFDDADVVGAAPTPPEYQCSQCGWNPPDPTNPPKFCPECGHRFDDSDIK